MLMTWLEHPSRIPGMFPFQVSINAVIEILSEICYDTEKKNVERLYYIAPRLERAFRVSAQ